MSTPDARLLTAETVSDERLAKLIDDLHHGYSADWDGDTQNEARDLLLRLRALQPVAAPSVQGEQGESAVRLRLPLRVENTFEVQDSAGFHVASCPTARAAMAVVAACNRPSVQGGQR